MSRRILFIILILGAGLLTAAVWCAGQFNPTALETPGETETYLATKAKHWLVARRAGGVTPPKVEDLERARFVGEMNYGGSCSTCHGSDGRTPTDIGRSQYPPAPDLGSPAVQQWSDAELFWIIKNGIRHSGMPGFARIHSDEEIWQLVQFVRSLGGPKPASSEEPSTTN